MEDADGFWRIDSDLSFAQSATAPEDVAEAIPDAVAGTAPEDLAGSASMAETDAAADSEI